LFAMGKGDATKQKGAGTWALWDYRQVDSWVTYWWIGLLLVGDFILNILIIKFIAYTEIDWIAYMQEVAGVIEDGNWDYSQLKGDTGPLVYPAGFVWIYAVFYFVTSKGSNILLAQYLFAGLHTIFIAVLLILYKQIAEAIKMPAWAFILLILSRRIHSIFVLRLFNDCWAMLFLYISILYFFKYRWYMGSLFFTIALSIKMNILLFVPPLLVILVKARGWVTTFLCVGLIGGFQLLVGIPFLMHDPWAYLSCSFNFSRQFFYIWTVNWKLVSEEVFLSKEFSTTLLVIHLSLLVFFGFKWCAKEGGVFRVLLGKHRNNSYHITPAHMACLLFTGNFLGIMCSRSLHYQFYVWYYHTLPALLWLTPFPWFVKGAILLTIEVVWNIYPSNQWSSLALLLSHVAIAIGLVLGAIPQNLVYKKQPQQ